MMSTNVFSVVLVTTIAVFHSSHAATKMFTIGDQSPSITGAFGERLMNEDMVPVGNVNGLSKMVTLSPEFNYFGRIPQENTIFVGV